LFYGKRIAFLSMARRLTHLNALRAFESVARSGSYVSAANELGVTPAAVGQQVRALEAYLAAPLFERHGKKLLLTEPARAVLPEIAAAFDRLAVATEHLRESARGAARVAITLPPSFAAKWLIPRIEGFRMAHPDIDLRLDTTDRLSDLPRENVAVGIRYGSGRYPGLEATLLMNEYVFPVCSPALLASAGKTLAPADLLSFKLIHDTTLASHAEFPTWASWLKAAGVRRAKAPRGMTINSSVMSLQAAAEGQGVALARSVIAAGDLREGRLVAPVPPALPSCYAYYLVYPSGLPLSRAAALFCHWLKQEALEFEQQQAP
jgi:LysR family transcriptional regulator, glycine cleavage system transcriptional activator